MTRYWRDGFWRSRDGDSHWVRGHWVERFDWSRYVYDYSQIQSRLTEARVGKSATARYVNPNANCPICGDPVFFYQNAAGSRVYFDELGPPWPKHPCTDAAAYEGNAAIEETFDTTPQLRSPEEIDEINALLSNAIIDLELDFQSKYRAPAPQPVKIIHKISNGGNTMLVVEGFRPDKFRELLLVNDFPRRLKVGAILTISKKKASFVDPSSLEAKERQIERIKRVSSFLNFF